MSLSHHTITAAPLAAILSLFVQSATIGQAADPDKQVFTDAQSAGEEFAIQGEYSGTNNDASKSFGAQVIALGDGKFRLVGFIGGLPGAGWNPGDEIKSAEGSLDDGTLTLNIDDAEVVIGNHQLTVHSEGNVVARLQKTERESPTLGAKPPADAMVLFDGTTADQFEGGKMAGDKYLAASGCASKQKFGDHRLHLEFRTPFMPTARGQGRGNSGVYVQGRYEVQVLDSFGLDGKDNECGGIYKVAEPLINMCLPPLSWQTYDIDFTAARYDDSGNKSANAKITVKHNGILIHDDLELPHGTPGYQREAPGPEVLFLQDHGNPVVFRNIWVVAK